MMGHTHATIGIAAGLAVAVTFQQPPDQAALLGVLGGFAAIMPDIDHPQSGVRRKLGFVGDVLFFWAGHRGLTHTIWAWVLFAYVMRLYAPWPVALANIAGYGSHILADILTVQGLPLLYPVSDRRIHLPPNLKTGGWAESIVWLLALGAVIALTANILQ